jgi:hypothetical protein
MGAKRRRRIGCLRAVVGISYPMRLMRRLRYMLRLRGLTARIMRMGISSLGRWAQATRRMRASNRIGEVPGRLLARALRPWGTGEILRRAGDISLVVRLKRLTSLLGIGLYGIQVVRIVRRWSGRALGCVTWRATNPPGPGRTVHLRLIGLRMHVLWQWGARRARDAGGGGLAQQLEASLDVDIGGVQLSGSLISVQGVGSLIVARLILRTVSWCHAVRPI